ncbi:MAG: Nramp family divalent metal transporter [Patescibacteria group bacterium]
MFHFRKLIKNIGPGVITGASDDDPSGIVTYSQTGARYGYGLLWLSLFTTPLMMVAQEISARLGIVTKQGLNRLVKRYVSKRAAFVLALGLLVVNVVNIGADLSAMGAVTQLLLPGPAWLYLVLFAMVIILLEIFVSYVRYVNVLKWLTLALLAYVVAAFATRQDWATIFRATVIPTLNQGAAVWPLITAILGTTISPYLFYWQESEEVEEEKLREAARPAVNSDVGGQLKKARWDTVVGMLFSNVIMFFIIIVAAGTLHQAGITNIESARQAAEALRPIAGSLTFFLFALGILGTGLLAIPVLAGSAAYALAEVFNWPEGLGKKFQQAKAFYITISAAIVIGALATLTGVAAIQFLIAAAVLNGLLAPVILFYMLRLADRRDVVGGHRHPSIVRGLGWLTFAVMTGAGVMTIMNIWR